MSALQSQGCIRAQQFLLQVITVMPMSVIKTLLNTSTSIDTAGSEHTKTAYDNFVYLF